MRTTKRQMAGGLCFVGLAAALLAATRPALAGAPTSAPATQAARPDQHTIYIPYKDLQKVFEKEGRGVYLPYEEFMRLVEEAKGAGGAGAEAPVAALLSGAKYTGVVKDDLATIDAAFDIQVLRAGWSQVPVGLTGVAISKATLDGEPARLVPRADGGYELLVSEKGAHQLAVTFAVSVKSEPGLKSFAFGSPSVPVAQLQVDVPEKDVEVEVQPLLAATRTAVGESSRVLALLGSTGSVKVQWKPRPLDVSKLKPLLFATTNTYAALQEGVVRTTVTMAIEVLRAPVSTFRVALPKGARLIAITGVNLKTWAAADEAARQVLTADLHAGITGAYTLQLQLEQLLADQAKETTVPDVSLIGADRETGAVAVSAVPTLQTEVLAHTNLSQLDLKELPAALQKPDTAFGYQFLKHPVELRLSVTRVVPKIAVVTMNQVTIEKDRVILNATLSYDIRKVGVFGLRVQVPPGFEVTQVGTPGTVSDSRIRAGGAGQPTIVEVDLPQRTMGAFQLPIRAEMERKMVAGSVPVPTVQALDVDTEEGHVAVLHPEALKIVPGALTGLQAVPTSELLALGVPPQDSRGNLLKLAFRYNNRRLPIRVALDVTLQQPKVSAEVLSRYDTERDVVRAGVTVRYTIEYAGIDTLKFQVPKSISDRIKVTGAGLKEQKALPPVADQDPNWVTWQAVRQAPGTGVYLLNIAYDLDVPATKGETPASLALPVVRVKEADPSIERETGQLAIAKTADLGVTPDAKNLEVIDLRELDPLLQRGNVVAAFKYQKSDYTLTLDVSRREFAVIATTVATKATLETIVAKDGAATTRARWRIKTTDRQFLDVTLPPKAEFAGVAVDGRPVAPQKAVKADTYMIRLAASAGDEKESLVEVVYRTPAPNAPRVLTLTAPSIPADVPVQKLYWALYVSEDRQVRELTAPTLDDETTWTLRWSYLGPVVRPQSPIALPSWIGAGASPVTFEAPANAKQFLLSGSGTNQSAAGLSTTLVTDDRRTTGIVVFAALALIGLVFALASLGVKGFVLVVLIGAVLLGAVANKTMVLDGISAGGYGIVALAALWILGALVRIPIQVRRRRRAVAEARAAEVEVRLSEAQASADEHAAHSDEEDGR